jgi:hypothetical protein
VLNADGLAQFQVTLRRGRELLDGRTPWTPRTWSYSIASWRTTDQLA